jgi:hypothetical protein
VAIKPIDVITLARGRIARIASIRASAYFVVPALTAIGLGILLPWIGAMTWGWMGYLLAPDAMDIARISLIVVGAIAIVAGLIRGWRAYSESNDFVGAAIRIDDRVDAHQQVVTLATLSDPTIPEASRTVRSPLLPVLMRNVISALGAFNPEKEFTFEVGEPIKQSMLPAGAIAIGLGIAMLALVRPPTPLQKTAIELRRLADKIEASAKSDDDQKLAERVKHAAADIENPKLPPEEKRKEIETILASVEKKEAQAGDTPGDTTGGKGSSAGTSSSSAAGGEKGKGEGGQGQGQSKGQNKGKGSGTGEGAGGQNQGGGKKKGDKNGRTADSVELRNELAKAEAQVQTDDISANQSPSKPSPDQKTAQATQAGSDPNRQGGSEKNENQKGSAPMPVPQNNNTAQNQMPNGGAGKKNDKGGTTGDTHLGEFPSAANYQRFLKPGEKGMALNLNDARYVVFKIPASVASGGDGKTVIDTERPSATTAYTNAPLVPTSDTAPPDERQLVPPRYRELIH